MHVGKACRTLAQRTKAATRPSRSRQMDTILNPNLKQAKSNLAMGLAVFLGAALAAHTLAAHAIEREAVSPRVEIAPSIAQQGNEAVRRIRSDARQGARLARPAPL